MDRRHFALGLVSAGVGSAGARPGPVLEKQQVLEQHIAWVGDVLTRIEAIRPGMTRQLLLTAFKPQEGGLFSALYRVFVSRECPYFKVVVEFRAVGRPVQTSIEDGGDVIVAISKPYLEAGSPSD